MKLAHQLSNPGIRNWSYGFQRQTLKKLMSHACLRLELFVKSKHSPCQLISNSSLFKAWDREV